MTHSDALAAADILARHPLVARFADAPPERGGWGATIAWLSVAPVTSAPGSPGDRE